MVEDLLVRGVGVEAAAACGLGDVLVPCGSEGLPLRVGADEEDACVGVRVRIRVRVRVRVRVAVAVRVRVRVRAAPHACVEGAPRRVGRVALGVAPRAHVV